MREEITVLVADDNIEFSNLLNNYLNRENDISVVGIARDGFQAINMIQAHKPDLVILDIIMPKLDGIGVLEKVFTIKIEHKPTFIMLTAIGQEKFIQKAMALGADYYFIKPFDVDILITRIRQLIKEKRGSQVSFSSPILKPVPAQVKINDSSNSENKLEIEVTNLMHNVGIPIHMTGYQYIREAILQAIHDSKSFSSVTKVLYPGVARKFNSTPQKVERSIRNAIEAAWSKENQNTMYSFFGCTINQKKGKPTNSEFIAMMADKIKLSQKAN